MSTTEVPYELWKNVFRLGRSNTFVRDPRGFLFDKDGDMGSMSHRGPGGKLLRHSPDEPVTNITMHDAAAWCNALSVQESREPCYYEDAAFKTVFHFVVRSPAYGEPRPLPKLYVKWAADGYRLPTPAEWEVAARGSTFPNGKTHSTLPVDSGKRSPLGLYNMLGNVWELVWDFGDCFDPTPFPPMPGDTRDVFFREGAYQTDPEMVSSPQRTYTVVGGDFNRGKAPPGSKAGRDPVIGLRLVRRVLGGPAQPDRSIADDTPMRKRLVVPIYRPLTKASAPKLDMVTIPDKPFVIARTETSYAQWLPVYQWAIASGYEFDHDGDMGSMDYWGFRMNSPDLWDRPTAHGPDEPVTDIAGYDAQVWCNALSAMEGRTPVYYSDKACTKVYKKAYRHRPVMMLFFETWEKMRPTAGEVVYAKLDANGYRLPTIREFYSVAGNASSGGKPAGWFFDNAGGTTHPVGSGTPNQFGLLNMRGNVSELAEGGRSTSAMRLGGSFLDLTIAGGGTGAQGKGTWHPKGWGYPDIGFRVVRKGGK